MQYKTIVRSYNLGKMAKLDHLGWLARMSWPAWGLENERKIVVFLGGWAGLAVGWSSSHLAGETLRKYMYGAKAIMGALSL